ncbi:hypothetical protein I3760_07G176100 [Carya illinoinensis]|nr:hypothetical protein I3760_07G176100 [Carya illinoinensis]
MCTYTCFVKEKVYRQLAACSLASDLKKNLNDVVRYSSKIEGALVASIPISPPSFSFSSSSTSHFIHPLSPSKFNFSLPPSISIYKKQSAFPRKLGSCPKTQSIQLET